MDYDVDGVEGGARSAALYRGHVQRAYRGHRNSNRCSGTATPPRTERGLCSTRGHFEISSIFSALDAARVRIKKRRVRINQVNY